MAENVKYAVSVAFHSIKRRKPDESQWIVVQRIYVVRFVYFCDGISRPTSLIHNDMRFPPFYNLQQFMQIFEHRLFRAVDEQPTQQGTPVHVH